MKKKIVIFGICTLLLASSVMTVFAEEPVAETSIQMVDHSLFENAEKIELDHTYTVEAKSGSEESYDQYKILELKQNGILTFDSNKPRNLNGTIEAVKFLVYSEQNELLSSYSPTPQEMKAQKNEYQCHVGLAAGTYHIFIQPGLATGYDRNSGYPVVTTYSFSFVENNFAEKESNATRETATQVMLNKVYTGYLNLSGGYDDRDYYVVNLKKGSEYRLVLPEVDKYITSKVLIYINDTAVNKYFENYKYVSDKNGYPSMEFTAGTEGPYYVHFENYMGQQFQYQVGIFEENPTELPEDLDHYDGWMNNEEGKACWYENGVRQGTYDDPKGVVGDGTVRGREIYDPKSNGWYWLDASHNGAKAVNKEVWMPYIYQTETSWDEEEIWANAKNSGSMAQQVHDAILLNGKIGGGKWVRYDANGAMIKGWYTVTEEEVATNSEYSNQLGNTYYYDWMTGLMAKGWVNIDGVNYHFDETTGAKIE